MPSILLYARSGNIKMKKFVVPRLLVFFFFFFKTLGFKEKLNIHAYK